MRGPKTFQQRRRSGGGCAGTQSADPKAELGFTLIELLVVIAIIPLVVGAISVALLSVLTQQNTVSSRITDSGDASVASANFVKDAQSAQSITTSGSVSVPSSCGTTTPFVSFQWPQTATVVVSYAVVPHGTPSSNELVRYYCQGSIHLTRVVAHNVQSSLAVAITGSSCTPGTFHCSTASTAAAAGWTSTAGVSGVALTVQAPEKTAHGTSTYTYTLVGVPRVSTNTSRGSPAAGHPPLLMLGTGSPDVSCTGHDSLTVNGIASINSSAAPAMQTNGTASISASAIYTDTPSASGAFSGNNISPSTPTQTGVTATDPYAALAPPITEPLPGGVGTTYGGYNVFSDSNLAADGPGIYKNAVSLNGAATIPSGVYIFQNGLSLSGNGFIQSAAGGVLFYIYQGSVSMTGNGGVTLQPLASPPSPAPNLTVWQDKSDSSAMTLGGNGSATSIGGTVYAPSVTLTAGGNGSLNVGSLVAASISCHGGGSSGGINIG